MSQYILLYLKYLHMEPNLDIPLTALWRSLYLHDFQSKQASFIFYIQTYYAALSISNCSNLALFSTALGRDDRMEFRSLSNASSSAIVVIECINSLFSILFYVFLYLSFSLASKINHFSAMS